MRRDDDGPRPATGTGRPPSGGDDSSRSLAADAVSAFVNAPIAVAVCEPDGTVTRVNGAVTHLLGYPESDLVGRSLFRLVEAERVAAAVAACASLRDRSVDTVVHETRFHTQDGRLLDIRVTTSAVRAPATRHPHAIMHLEDVTEREELRRRLQHEVNHDPLTGLCNRALFLEQLRRALPRGARHGQPVTVLYLDLDHFKTVNDTHGHAAGDRLLVDFSRHVRDTVRPEDTAARLGGDEFAVLCENTTPEEAALIARRLADVTSIGSGSPSTRPVGVTVGFATSSSRGVGPSAEELLHEADAAMYRARSLERS